MEAKRTIRSNEELYGDLELIPLNLDAVQQRIDFFSNKVGVMLNSNYNSGELNTVIKHWDFWKEIKEKHCLKECM